MRLIWATTILPFWVAYRLIRACYLFSEGFVKIVINCRNLAALYRKWRDKDKPTHGDASFATDKELKARGHFKPHGFLMGLSEKGKHIFTHPERTALVLAPPGAGKSQHLIANLHAIAKRPDDSLPFLILGDAADELYGNCAALLKARGYDIFKIDCVEPDGWAKYDILSGLNPSFHTRHVYGRQLKALTELIVPDEANSKQPHFVEFARLLLKCVITVNVKYEGNNKPIGDLISELLSEKKRTALVKRIGAYNDDIVQETLETMNKMQDKPEGLSMMTTALRKLESWGDEALREITNYGTDMHGNYVRGWDFEKMLTHPRPVALFLRTGTQKMGGDFARIVYGNAINTVAMMLDRDKKPLSRELEVIIDEAGLAGYCNAVIHAYNRLRKAGVRIRMCFLGLEEFKNTYSDYKTLVAGSDFLVHGGSNDMEWYKMVSEMAGEYTVQSRSENQSNSGESRGKSEQPRKLVKQDEGRRLPLGQVIMLLGNLTVRGRASWRINKRTGKPEYL
jgi:type IV secretion system protein VirD4